MARRPRVLLPIALLLCVAGLASAETYDYVVDRFEADGNVNGPFDGVVDHVDEFDDDVLAPWVFRRGTASTESGGLLHVKSPGLHIDIPGIFSVPFEASAVGVNDRLHVGNGDATLRVVLPLQTIGANDSVSFDLESVEDNGLYYTGVVITNYNVDVASRFTPAWPVGLAVNAHFERLGLPQEHYAQHHKIAPAAMTGPIVLELRYDDATHMVTPAVSLDGGTTYEAVFDPYEVESDTGEVIVQVAVAAYEGACPAQQKIRKATFSGIGGDPGKQRLKMRIAFPSNVLTSGFQDPVRFIVDDLGAGTTLYDITLPDGVTAFQHACDPRDRWSSRGYINKSNALPPACVPGSAQGFQKLSSNWSGTNDVRVQIKNTTFPAVVGPIRTTIYDGTGPTNECDGWVGEAPCITRGKSTRCGVD
jgi:hypothetical protein